MVFRDRITVVTGATRGIGRAIAVEAARAGSDLVLLGRNVDLLTSAKIEIEGLGRRAVAMPLNVANQSEVEEAFKIILKEFPKIDFLINNAGITRDNLLLTMKPEEWNEVLETNLYGVFHCRKRYCDR
jgi:3-oxoacyl-[acyl-carrier protein] reductase